MTFKPETITDQKRFVRGEHWLFARNILRARDAIHHADWRVMIVSGPKPSEEINCIRALMPRSHITAVDRDKANITAALSAGADVGLCIDLAAYPDNPPAECRNFDVICLDLCGPVSIELKQIVRVFMKSLVCGGVMIVNFSYGRDVVEWYHEEWRRMPDDSLLVAKYRKMGLPRELSCRIHMLLRSQAKTLRSVIQYAGNAMPMISLLIQKGSAVRPLDGRYEKILPDDFVLAVTAEDIGAIYACPQDRITALRRSASAQKAVQTRRINAGKKAAMNGGEHGTALTY